MSIKLKLTGFEKILEDIQAAEGDIMKATENSLKQSASIMQSELKSEMKKSNVPSSLISAMPQFTTEIENNEVTARVGYRKGAYDPNNPSDGYKVVFLNYGTPHRSKHGKIVDISEGGTIQLGFIQRAKETAKPKIRKAQKQALKKILARLKK